MDCNYLVFGIYVCIYIMNYIYYVLYSIIYYIYYVYVLYLVYIYIYMYITATCIVSKNKFSYVEFFMLCSLTILS